MTLARRQPKRIKNFALPVSYRLAEDRERLADALNVISYQKRLDTRFGYSRFNATALGGSVVSVSYYEKDDGSRFVLAKVGDTIYAVGSDSTLNPHTTLIAGLNATARHRGFTFNGRHIVTVEGDSRMYAYNGTIFSYLGQAKPTLPPIVVEGGGGSGTLPNSNEYRVKATFYSSITGFESNPNDSYTSETTTAANNSLVFTFGGSFYPTNRFIDKIRIYVQDYTASSSGDFLLAGEVLAPQSESDQTTFLLEDPVTSTTAVPDSNYAAPPGARYMTSFGTKLVIAGIDDYESEVRFSESDDPDSFDDDLDALVLIVKGNGPITGLATGAYFGDFSKPFLVMFKRKSIEGYTTEGGQFAISREIGCVSHDTIIVKENGDVTFLSELGWRVISNGRLVTSKKDGGKVATLGDGDIDNIFVQKGFDYEVNRTLLDKAFSVYFGQMDQYMTWVAEGATNTFSKTWVYEYEVGGFKPWKFALAATCACSGVDNQGRDCILFGDANGYIYQHSIHEKRSDVNASNVETAINAFAQIYWIPFDGDYAVNYDFRDLLVRARYNEGTINVSAWTNFNFETESAFTMDFGDPTSSFVLDVTQLDVGRLGNSLGFGTFEHDVNVVGESLLLEFSQNTTNKNLGLISAQVEMSANGNRNTI